MCFALHCGWTLKFQLFCELLKLSVFTFPHGLFVLLTSAIHLALLILIFTSFLPPVNILCMLEHLWNFHHHAPAFSFLHVRWELLCSHRISTFPQSFSFSQIQALFSPQPFASVQSTFLYQRGTSIDFLLFIRISRFYFSLFKFRLLTSLQEKTYSYWTFSLLWPPSKYSFCVTRHLSSKSFVVLCSD